MGYVLCFFSRDRRYHKSMRWRDVKQHKITKQQEALPESQTLPYASIPDKIKAFITDSFLLAMPLFYIVIYLVLDGLGGADGVEGNRLLTWGYVLLPLSIIVTIFYVKTGQTPGMKAYKVKVIDNKTHEKPSVLLAFLRFFFFNIAIFSILGLLISFFREDKRGIHDLFSGTSVLKVADA